MEKKLIVTKALSMAGLAALFTGCFHENDQYFESLDPKAPGSVSDAAIGAAGEIAGTSNNGANSEGGTSTEGGGVSTGGGSTGGGSTGGGSTGGGSTGGGCGGGSEVEDPPVVVCDPFVNDPLIGSNESAVHGLKATMKYIEASRINSVPHNNIQNYLDNGTAVNANFYFAQIYTPTRKFSDGFDIGNGQKLKDNNGNILTENFVMTYETHLRLPKGSPNRKVQFALLADDGARMYVKVGNSDANGWREVVYDDMTHPTKMGCGVEPIEVSADQDLHVKVEYFQGPRYHIALTLMWRNWELDNPAFNPSDASCGKSGNNLFWDSAYSPSREQPEFLGLLDRGWSVVPAEMFYVDDINSSTGTVNPCVK